jgi:hypothetical protein
MDATGKELAHLFPIRHARLEPPNKKNAGPHPPVLQKLH